MLVGEIDSDDSLAIKKGCKTQIGSIGVVLENATLKLISVNKDLYTFVKMLSCLTNIYEGVNTELKRRILSLITYKRIEFENRKTNLYLNKEATIIYKPDALNQDLSGFDLNLITATEPEIISDIDPSIIENIIAIEKDNGRSLTDTAAKKIAELMIAMADIVLKF